MASRIRLQTLIELIEQSLVLIIWLVLCMGLFYPWDLFAYPGVSETQITGSGTTRAIYLILLFLILLLSTMRLKGIIRQLLLAWPVLILCAWILLSVTWAPEPVASLSTAVRFFVIVMFSAYVVETYDTLRFVSLLTRGFAIAALLSFAVVILFPSLARANLAGDYADAWRGAFAHKNGLGFCMSFGVIVSGYSYATRTNVRFLSGATFLGCLCLLILSRSATSIVATLASGLVIVANGLDRNEDRQLSPQAMYDAHAKPQN